MQQQQEQGQDNASTSKAADGDGDFIPSAGFTGAKEGFVFKSGTKGIGYYKDCPPQPAAATRGGTATQKPSKPIVLKSKPIIAVQKRTGSSGELSSSNKKKKTGACTPRQESVGRTGVAMLSSSSFAARPCVVNCSKRGDLSGTLPPSTLVLLCASQCVPCCLFASCHPLHPLLPPPPLFFLWTGPPPLDRPRGGKNVLPEGDGEIPFQDLWLRYLTRAAACQVAL